MFGRCFHKSIGMSRIRVASLGTCTATLHSSTKEKAQFLDKVTLAHEFLEH